MDGENRVRIEEVKYVSDNSSTAKDAAMVFVCILGAGLVVKSVFELGLGIADKMFKRHDKDVRMMEKKAKKEQKEKLKEEKRAEKAKLKKESESP